MVIVSYDISDDLIRSRFQRMLTKNGAIRLQYSVYEVVNTKRVIENIKLKIVAYSKHFSADVHIPKHTRSLSGSLLGYKTIP